MNKLISIEEAMELCSAIQDSDDAMISAVDEEGQVYVFERLSYFNGETIKELIEDVIFTFNINTPSALRINFDGGEREEEVDLVKR